MEVGEYVRSLINGNIFKVIEVSDLLKEPRIKYYKFDKFRGMCSTEEYNTKHSKDITDLIKKGDYVNGYKVVEVTEHTFTTMEQGGYKVHHKECVSIKTILTKELFEANCYKVKEE